MKKIISVLLVLSIFICFAAGCGSKESSVEVSEVFTASESADKDEVKVEADAEETEEEEKESKPAATPKPSKKDAEDEAEDSDYSDNVEDDYVEETETYEEYEENNSVEETSVGGFDAACNCIGSSVDALYGVCGYPDSSYYVASCSLGDEQDGFLYYSDYIVYTMVMGDGSEIIVDVDTY